MMDTDAAVATIAGVIQDFDSVDVDDVAGVIFRAIDRANVNMIAEGRLTGGSGWRQGVVSEIYKRDFGQR